MRPPVPKTTKLSDYPWVLVRLGCGFCKRGGQYRLAGLAAKYGPEAPLEYVLDGLAGDCPWRAGPGEKARRKYEAKCDAHFPDLKRNVPPDLPPGLWL